MNKKIALITLGFMSAAGPFSIARADDVSRMAAARELVAATHAADSIKKNAPVAFKSILASLSASQKTEIPMDKIEQAFAQRVNQDSDQLVDALAKIYADELSEEDIRNMVTFYKTPTGDRLLEKLPVITKKAIVLAPEWGRKVATEAFEDVTKNMPAPTQAPAAAPAPSSVAPPAKPN